MVLFNFCLAVVLISAIFLLSKKSKLDLEKISPFECGFRPKANRRITFSIQFFLVTLIFLIFDVELILMFPFLGVLSLGLNRYNFLSLILFIVVLSLGLF